MLPDLIRREKNLSCSGVPVHEPLFPISSLSIRNPKSEIRNVKSAIE
jgi:hypothetical protein